MNQEIKLNTIEEAIEDIKQGLYCSSGKGNP